MHRLTLAVIDPANTPHGYNWTFAFPMLLFIVIAAILYALFSRPHHRVPARRISIPDAASAPDARPARAEAADKPAAGPGDGSEASE